MIVTQATWFAIGAHEAVAQLRKYTGEPYWHHCREVHNILYDHAVHLDDRMLAAAWLHDVVEDTAVTLEQVRAHFGDYVARLVSDLTDVSRPEDGNRAHRKHLDLLHTAEACPEAKTIKLADIISNSSSIETHDPDFARVWIREKERLLAVLTEGDPVLWRMAAAQINPLLSMEDVS